MVLNYEEHKEYSVVCRFEYDRTEGLCRRVDCSEIILLLKIYEFLL